MIFTGDCRDVLLELQPGSVQCVVTSPPYWGLRDYGVEGQCGLEATPEAYVDQLVEIFRHVRRVLKDDGTVWLNLGDCYAGSGCGGDTGTSGLEGSTTSQDQAKSGQRRGHRSSFRRDRLPRQDKPHKVAPAIKAKDLIGIPWLVAFALRADGWYLRSDVIWAKPNPMPESVTDRPTKAHEYLFLLTKSARYYYDAAAIREPYAESTMTQFEQPYDGTATKDYAGTGAQNPSDVKKRIVDNQRGHGRRHAGFNDRWDASVENKSQYAAGNIPGQSPHGYTKREDGLTSMAPLGGANKRTVWTVPTQPFPGAHFATFPEALIEPCILAGSRQGDVVLDPFCGAGTVGVVCAKAQRPFVGIELNPEYVAIAEARIGQVAPLFREVSA